MARNQSNTGLGLAIPDAAQLKPTLHRALVTGNGVGP